MSGPRRDWSARAKALDHYEKALKQAKRFNDDDKEMIEEVVNALRRSQDHTAIQTKLQQTINANLKMRDKLLEWAKECASCEGKGVVTVMRYAGDPLYFEGEKVERVEPCGDCADIREALGQ